MILIWCNKKIPLTCMCKYLNMCAWNWFLIQLSFKLHLNTAFEEKKNNLCFLFDITYISDDRQRFISDIISNHYSFPHHINTIYMIHKKHVICKLKNFASPLSPGAPISGYRPRPRIILGRMSHPCFRQWNNLLTGTL